MKKLLPSLVHLTAVIILVSYFVRNDWRAGRALRGWDFQSYEIGAYYASIYTLKHRQLPSSAYRQFRFNHLNDKQPPTEEDIESEAQRQVIQDWLKWKGGGKVETNAEGKVFVAGDALFDIKPPDELTEREKLKQNLKVMECEAVKVGVLCAIASLQSNPDDRLPELIKLCPDKVQLDALEFYTNNIAGKK